MASINVPAAMAWLVSQQEASQGFLVSLDSDYTAPYFGTISGTIAETEMINLADYDIRVFVRTDVDYLQQQVLLAGPTFATPTPVNVPEAGVLIVRLYRIDTGRIVSSTEYASAAGYQGLVRSFTIPFDDPGYGYEGGTARTSGYRLEQRTWIYDDALAAIAFNAGGLHDRARLVLQQLADLQNLDGTLAFSYDVLLGTIFDLYVRTGALAWVGMACVYFEQKTGSADFRPMAVGLAGYLLTKQVLTPGDPRYGSIRGGHGRYDDAYDFHEDEIEWVSTEHNIDSYFFLRDLGQLTLDPIYADAANLIKANLLTNHWDPTRLRLYQGVHLGGPDPADALDCGTWGGMFLQSVGEAEKAIHSILYVQEFEVIGADIPLSADPNDYNLTYSHPGPITGYKPYKGPEYPGAPSIVWAEGTYGAIMLRKRMNAPTDLYEASMVAMQSANPFGGTVQVTGGYSDLPYEFHVWPALAAVGWGLILELDPWAVFTPDPDVITPADPPEEPPVDPPVDPPLYYTVDSLLNIRFGDGMRKVGMPEQPLFIRAPEGFREYPGNDTPVRVLFEDGWRDVLWTPSGGPP